MCACEMLLTQGSININIVSARDSVLFVADWYNIDK